jgi:hypothetical protein
LQPCGLYYTKKTAVQRLFVAAAALYWYTNDHSWRTAADSWYAAIDDKSLFYSNWDNTVAQGVTIMASNPAMDVPVPKTSSRAKWQTLLRNGAKLWSDCATLGSKGDFCKCAFAFLSRRILKQGGVVLRIAPVVHQCQQSAHQT